MKVLVTGASGFVGSHVAQKLVEAGHEVRVLRRAISPTRLLEGLPLETEIGDVTDPASLDQAVRGCEAVFHVAGLVAFWRGNNEALYKVNVEGTRNIVSACLQNRVRRLIHTSSVAAIGFPPNGQPGDETLPYNWGFLRIPYCDTKKMAEEEVRKGIAQGLDAVILNPAVVFGAGDLHFHGSAMVLQMAKGRIRRWMDGGCSTCDVEDVAAAHLAALEKGRSGERYILAGENLCWKNLFARIAAVVGSKPPQKKIPLPLLRLYAASLDLKSRFTGRRPAVSPEAIRISAVPAYYSSQKAVRELGYRMRPLDESLRMTYDWYRQNGFQ